MYKVWTDVPRNRLYMSMSGVISYEEAEECSRRVILATRDLKAGFDVINNLTYYKSWASISASAPLKTVVEHFKNAGVGRVIRVVGGSKAALIQATLGFNATYGIIYVPTVEEAERKLAVKETALA